MTKPLLDVSQLTQALELDRTHKDVCVFLKYAEQTNKAKHPYKPTININREYGKFSVNGDDILTIDIVNIVNRYKLRLEQALYEMGVAPSTKSDVKA